ncbi:MAG: RNA polymerase sigma factor [Ignavibacteria bacterium]|jgi:RNA polymerase sigma-70 factor (ECF subfamily)
MPKAKENDLVDSELIKGIKQSDKEAFRKLYYKYFDKLIRFAYYRTNSIETSRDLVQEIFFKVWQMREKLNPDKSIKSYLYKSLSNSIINHIKLASTKNISLEEVEFTNSTNNEKQLDTEIDLQNALKLLPEKLKTVYILSRVEGYKYEEIAVICAISIKAVEKRMSKAFEILRKYFNPPSR